MAILNRRPTKSYLLPQLWGPGIDDELPEGNPPPGPPEAPVASPQVINAQPGQTSWLDILSGDIAKRLQENFAYLQGWPQPGSPIGNLIGRGGAANPPSFPTPLAAMSPEPSQPATPQVAVGQPIDLNDPDLDPTTLSTPPKGYIWKWIEFSTPALVMDIDGNSRYAQGKWGRVETKPTKRDEQTILEVDEDGSQWLRTYSLDAEGQVTGMVRQTQKKPAPPAKTNTLPYGWKENYTTANGEVKTWNVDTGTYVTTDYVAPPKEPPKTYPLPAGQDKEYVDAAGNTWRWDESKGDYNVVGYQRPPEAEVEVAERATGRQKTLADALRQQWAEQNRFAEQSWTAARQSALDEMQRQREARQAEKEAAEAGYQTNVLLPFSAMLAQISQRSPATPQGQPATYLPFLAALMRGAVPPEGAPQPPGSQTPLWNLPGGQVATIQERRRRGIPVAGTEAPWIDVNGVRVFGGSPEYANLVAAGNKPYIPPMSDAMIEQFTPGFNQANPWATADMRGWQQTTGLGRSYTPLEIQAANEEEKRQQANLPLFTERYRGRRRPVWQG